MEDSDDDFDANEWWNKVVNGAKARTGKDVLVEACEKSKAEEESEESDDGSDEQSGEEGPREEFGEEAELTRRDLDKSLWHHGNAEDEKEQESGRTSASKRPLEEGNGGQQGGVLTRPSAICPHSPRSAERKAEEEGWTRKSRAKTRNTGIIYKVTLKATGEAYVGMTEVSFKKRMQGHKSKALSDNWKSEAGCRKLNAKIRAHGWDAFHKECLYANVPKQLLPSLEITMIALHGTRAGPNGTGGLNLTDGGERSPMLDPEVRKRAREVMKSPSVLAKRSKVFSSTEFKSKVGKESKAVWEGYSVDERNARAEIMAAASRRGWIQKRETKMATMAPLKAKSYWKQLKNRGMERARRHLRNHPERYVGRDPIAELEEWWGPSFEERRRE